VSARRQGVGCPTRFSYRGSGRYGRATVDLPLLGVLEARVDDGPIELGPRKQRAHITAEHLRKRLAPHGIASRPGRHGALLALAGRLPAPILAERLGIHQARAAQWARAAGATYARYVRLRAERSARHG
jgi:hypothetical protein